MLIPPDSRRALFPGCAYLSTNSARGRRASHLVTKPPGAARTFRPGALLVPRVIKSVKRANGAFFILTSARAVNRVKTRRRLRRKRLEDARAGGSAPVSKEEIEGIKDPVRRVQARAANVGLYRNS